MWGEGGSENNSGCIKRDQGGAEEERRGRRRRRKEGREEKEEFTVKKTEPHTRGEEKALGTKIILFFLLFFKSPVSWISGLNSWW